MKIVRLGVGDIGLAKKTFETMSDVFGEPHEELDDAYLSSVLARDSFWALAAVDGDEVLGGLTAHELAMTRARESELFIYDLAVREDRQRAGVGRALVRELIAAAAASGIQVAFVPVDNGDAHALEFYRAIGGTPAAITLFTFGDD
jgi:aminoglycoside 3-N-acetyltransferase I